MGLSQSKMCWRCREAAVRLYYCIQPLCGRLLHCMPDDSRQPIPRTPGVILHCDKLQLKMNQTEYKMLCMGIIAILRIVLKFCKAEQPLSGCTETMVIRRYRKSRGNTSWGYLSGKTWQESKSFILFNGHSVSVYGLFRMSVCMISIISPYNESPGYMEGYGCFTLLWIPSWYGVSKRMDLKCSHICNVCTCI